MKAFHTCLFLDNPEKYEITFNSVLKLLQEKVDIFTGIKEEQAYKLAAFLGFEDKQRLQVSCYTSCILYFLVTFEMLLDLVKKF